MIDFILSNIMIKSIDMYMLLFVFIMIIFFSILICIIAPKGLYAAEQRDIPAIV